MTRANFTPSCKSDILLHQSGHIMLSDFDLAKQASERGGKPAGIQQDVDGVRNSDRFACHNLLTGFAYLDTYG